ncbi:MAG: hypothetical protein L0312_20140 [Acidobacteria bacterium]|nr:hypothetical protein [Acidobacteriota bacterium]
MGKKRSRAGDSQDPDVREALEQVQRITGLIEDDVPDWAKDKAPDFFEDVAEKVRSVGETIERMDSVTDGQRRALNNWESGVRRWIRDDD